MIDFDADATAAENAAPMRDAVARVRTGEVTQAVRDSEGECGPIAAGDWIAVTGDGIRGGDVDRRGRGRRDARRHDPSTPTSWSRVLVGADADADGVARVLAHVGRAPPRARGRGPRRRPAAVPVRRRRRVVGESRTGGEPGITLRELQEKPVTELKAVGPKLAPTARVDGDHDRPRSPHALPAPLPRPPQHPGDRRARGGRGGHGLRRGEEGVGAATRASGARSSRPRSSTAPRT